MGIIYTAKVGVFEALTAAMNPASSAISARRDFDRQNVKEIPDFLNTTLHLDGASPK